MTSIEKKKKLRKDRQRIQSATRADMKHTFKQLRKISFRFRHYSVITIWNKHFFLSVLSLQINEMLQIVIYIVARKESD